MPKPVKCNENAWPFRVPPADPETAPALAGEKAQNIGHDFPGAKLVPWQSCTPPRTPAAPPVPDMTCGTPLTFFMGMACSAVVVSTGTYPSRGMWGYQEELRVRRLRRWRDGG